MASSPVLDFAHWQSSASQVFVPLTVRPEDHRDFRGRLSQVRTQEATAVRLEARPHDVERSADHVRAGGRGFFKFSLQLQGSGILVQDGREITLSPGGITVYDTSRPYTLSYPEATTMLILMVSHERMGSVAHDVADLVATPLGRDGLADVVSPVLAGIAKRIDEGEHPTNTRLVRHAVELLETLCRDDVERRLDAAVGGEPLHGAAQNSARQRNLRRVLDHIEEHLADPQLSPQSIAEAHFMSVRSLYKLFDESGATVAAWIRSRRLERARQALSDPTRVDTTVGRIAAGCGMPDAAHFSKVFRDAYGVSPTEFRRGAAANIDA